MKKNKKILYAASTATHLRRFHMPYVEALKKDADVFLMATGEGVDFPVLFDKHYFSFANLRSLFAIRKILKREQFDTVILNTTLTAFWVRAAMLGMRKRPFVLNIVHGYLFPYEGGGLKRSILLFCEKLMRKKTDAIAVMNREDLKTATQYKLCRGNVYFTYGMGLSNTYAGSCEKDLALRSQYASEEQILCTYVGELSGRKNQSFLIRATKQLKENGVPIRLLLVGEGSEYTALQEEIKALGLQNDVFLAGHSDRVPALLAITDLYVSASVSEGLPFNLMEAMAYGLPILASNVRGQSDLLSDRAEMLYPLDDTEAFCNQFMQFYQTKKLGSNAYSYAELEQYLLSSVFEENMKILRMGQE
jgi:glycosyltransferase EpsD